MSFGNMPITFGCIQNQFRLPPGKLRLHIPGLHKQLPGRFPTEIEHTEAFCGPYLRHKGASHFGGARRQRSCWLRRGPENVGRTPATIAS